MTFLCCQGLYGLYAGVYLNNAAVEAGNAEPG